MFESFISERISELIVQKNISERQLSLDLGHSPSYINGITSGRKLPSLTEFLYICEYLQISPSEFFNQDMPSLLHTEIIDLISNLSDEDLALVLQLLKRLTC